MVNTLKKAFDFLSRHIWLQCIVVAVVFFGVSRLAGVSLRAVDGTGRLVMDQIGRASCRERV